LLYTVYYQSSD